MTIKELYKYKEGNRTIVTPDPERVPKGVSVIQEFRLIADEGKAVTKDGENLYPCIDVKSIDGWYEVDAPEEDDE